MSKTSFKSVVLVGASVIAVASLGTLSWCRIIGGCTFGSYKGTITFTNLETKEPLYGDKVSYQIDNSNFLFVNMGEYFTVETDSSGSADIEFPRTFYSSLFIALSKDNERKAEFRVFPDDIQTKIVIVRNTEDHYLYGDSQYDTVEMKLEIDSWSLF